MRLVAQGTIEELKYARQVYKVHLTQQTIESYDQYSHVQPARLFRGVDKDQNRKGELFGCENLLKFKDGSFMDDLWKASENIGNRNQIHEHRESEFVDALRGVNENVVQNGFVDEDEDIVDSIQETEIKGFNHEDFLREDRGAALLNPGDEGFEEELGGASQVHHFACDAACEDIVNESEEEEALLNDIEQSLLDNPSSTKKNMESEQKIRDQGVVRQTSKSSMEKTLKRKQQQKIEESSKEGQSRSPKAGEEDYRKNMYEMRRTKSLFTNIGEKRGSLLSTLGTIHLPAYLNDKN